MFVSSILSPTVTIIMNSLALIVFQFTIDEWVFEEMMNDVNMVIHGSQHQWCSEEMRMKLKENIENLLSLFVDKVYVGVFFDHQLNKFNFAMECCKSK